MSEWIALMAVGMLAGVASGMFGIGGGVIIVPALLLFGLAQFPTQATGTSLAALLPPVSAVAVWSYHRKQLIHWQSAVLIALGLLVGAVGGAQIAVSIQPQLLLRLYGVFLFYIGWRMAEPLQRWRTPNAHGTQVTDDSTLPTPNPLAVACLGLFAGVFSGMFGIGGGAVIVPILVAGLGFHPKQAIATSLGALIFPVGVGGVWVYYQNGDLQLLTALWVAAGLVMGAGLGARITISLPSNTIKRLYGGFALVMAVRYLLTA
ncbi:MAG: sulfite exporter TauE/SafE family protein [Phototrophicaceae bacterium]